MLNGASTNTSMNGIGGLCASCSCRASCRSETYGEIKAVRVMQAEVEKRSETSPIRRMFSSRSLGPKPRSWARWVSDGYARRTWGALGSVPCSGRIGCYRRRVGKRAASCAASAARAPSRSWTNRTSNAGSLRLLAKLTLPLALRPVNQTVAPF